MSKSLGNVISPYDLVKKYGTDATRYILLRHVHPVEDTDVTWDRLDEWYTANLANGLGNLVARVMKLSETHITELPEMPPVELYLNDILEILDKFEFKLLADEIWKSIEALDIRITKEEPFKLVRTNPQKGKQLITELVCELQPIAQVLAPLMPQTSVRILKAIQENKKPENLFPRL